MVACDKSFRMVDPITLTVAWLNPDTATFFGINERYHAVVENQDGGSVIIRVKRLNRFRATLFYTNSSLQHNPDPRLLVGQP